MRIICSLIAILLMATPAFADWHGEISTPWVDDGTQYLTKLSQEYSDSLQEGEYIVDSSGTSGEQIIPSLNMTTVYVMVNDTLMETIQNDSDYLVLWSEEYVIQ